jgi:hypothetical protein
MFGLRWAHPTGIDRLDLAPCVESRSRLHMSAGFSLVSPQCHVLSRRLWQSTNDRFDVAERHLNGVVRPIAQGPAEWVVLGHSVACHVQMH